MAGWIKTYRDLADHWLSQDLQKLGWWVILLLKVNHEDKKVLSGNQLIELKRGQIIASLSYLATLWKTSKRTAERFVELLESEQMVSRCMRQKVTVLTICNWDSYQGKDEPRRADKCANDAPIGIQSVSETKNEEECKEYISRTTTAHTHMREDDFIRQYREEGHWPTACVILHLKSVSEAESLFDRFILEYQHKGQSHPDYSNFKAHFIQWARITIQKEKYGENRTNQRRGVQVVANSVEDYQGPF